MRAKPAISFPKTLLVLVGVALATIVLSAWLRSLGSTSERNEASVFMSGADDLIGETVTLDATVGEILSAKSFTLRAEEGEVLVLDVSTVPAIDNDFDGTFVGEKVQVTGTVRELTAEELEAQLGHWTDRRYERFIGEPVIVASSVTPR